VSPHPSGEGRGSWVSGHARFGGDEEEDGGGRMRECEPKSTMM